MPKPAKIGRRTRGAAAIEFALVLPVLLFLVLGMVDYGWYFFCQLTVTNAAREGARAGTTVPGGDGGRATATTQSYLATAGLAGQPTQIDVNIGAAPTTVSVDVWMHFRPIIGFVPLPRDGGGPVAHARAVMGGVP